MSFQVAGAQREGIPLRPAARSLLVRVGREGGLLMTEATHEVPAFWLRAGRAFLAAHVSSAPIHHGSV